MSKNIQKILIPLCLVIVAAVVLMVLLLGKKSFRDDVQKVGKVGILITGSHDETGWNGMLYQGISRASSEMGMELLLKENVMEYTGQCPKAVEELIAQGAEIIFLTSFNYAEECRELIDRHPEILFYSDSAYDGEQTNISTYFPRMYQARYLAGIVAGATTETGVVGYVAAMNNSEVNRGINAFALGVQRANPEGKVVVAWTESWDNETLEREAAERLVKEAGADVLAYHQNLPNVVYEAEELGVYSIAYHVDGTELSSGCLTSVVCDWTQLYREILKEYASGKAEGGSFLWLGLEHQVVELPAYGEMVPSEVRELVEEAKQELIAGKEIFSGAIYDNQGEIRCSDGESISDRTLMFDMDWFVKGVTFYDK